MNLVLISGQYKKLEKKLQEIKTVTITKTLPPRVYFQIDSDINKEELIKQIKSTLYQDKSIRCIDFQIYGFYNGKIDFISYIPEDKKKEMKYYKK